MTGLLIRWGSTLIFPIVSSEPIFIGPGKGANAPCSRSQAPKSPKPIGNTHSTQARPLKPLTRTVNLESGGTPHASRRSSQFITFIPLHADCQAQVVVALAQELTASAAARQAGVRRTTIHHWLRTES